MSRSKWAAALIAASLAVLAAGVGAFPAVGVPKERTHPGDPLLNHLSQVVTVQYWAAHPEVAPAAFTARLSQVAGLQTADPVAGEGRDIADQVFNNDVLGLPQNEESVTTCREDTSVVLMGTNDFRGLLDPQGNLTGWHFSNNGGRSLTNEGLLPPVSSEAGDLPSGGDPVDVAGVGCESLYAASLAYTIEPDPFIQGTNGIAVYRSDPETLANCPGGSDPSCWPTRRLVAQATVEEGRGHFLDKEWIDVGVSGDAGEVVWAVYADFAIDIEAPFGFTGAEIFAVRCDAALESCTEPIPISVDDQDVQFADVTIAPDGRVYVTWSQITGELPTDPEFPTQTFIHKLRIAEPGSTEFGPERVVFEEDKAIPFGGFLHANDFRVATYPKNDVAILADNPRIFVVWDACRFRPLDFVCEEPEIKLVYSDDDGQSWSDVIVLSQGGDNYFPSIVSNDAGASPDGSDSEVSRRAKPLLAFAWFTNRFDGIFHNRQDVEFTTVDPADPRPGNLVRLTEPSNESEADPILGGFFIGDYIEVTAVGNLAYVGYNANYRQEQLLGPLGEEGIPVAQQDNYLAEVEMSPPR